MSIGKRIRSARELRGMTLDEVAKRCSTTKQTIFKYENEIVTNIPYDKIVLLSEALDVSPAYLFGWEEQKSSPDELQLTEGEKAMLELFRQIPADRQPEALEMFQVALKCCKDLNSRQSSQPRVIVFTNHSQQFQFILIHSKVPFREIDV